LLRGNGLNVCGGYEITMMTRTRMNWTKFQECGELLHGKWFPLKFKEKIYRFCIRSVMLYALSRKRSWQRRKGQKELWWGCEVKRWKKEN